MQSTHTPLQTWFWGAYLVTTQTPGQSALQFQRQLRLTRYETAFQILHKLRAGMVRPERDCIGGEHAVEVDECLVGGRTRGEGQGVHHRATVFGAVEVRLRKADEDRKARRGEAHAEGKPLKKLVYAGRIRLRYCPVDRNMREAARFITDNVIRCSTIKTDAWRGYNRISQFGYTHDRLLLAGDPEKSEAHLPLIHLVFSNLKTWILGTHHGAIAAHHLQAYLNEFVFRFNRRFYPMTAFNSVLGIAVRSTAPTYDKLYSGDWIHPGASKNIGSPP
jgi:transposase-like protein